MSTECAQPPKRVHLIVAARPNLIKVAPLWHSLSEALDFNPVVIHTGQHYDPNMSDAIMADLLLPAPDYYLGIRSTGHGEQTGRIMIAYEKIAIAESPDWLIVVGDVNSTLACALVGTKLGIPTVHLEAGLRSHDRGMPEEINRRAVDAIVDVLWTSSLDANENLLAEGCCPTRITNVGNIMMDSFELVRSKIEAFAEAKALGMPKRYGVVTLHRPSNVDCPNILAELVDALLAVQKTMPLVFPVHPRTAQRLSAAGLDAKLSQAGIKMVTPLPYIRFMNLVAQSACVITDSGGIQEETTYIGIPTLTLRKNTERPITITQGTNQLIIAPKLADKVKEVLERSRSQRLRPENWDGKTAGRCVADLRKRINDRLTL